MAKNYYVYVLECSDDSFYVGMTSDIDKRLIEHMDSKDPESYTAKRLPVRLLYYCMFSDPYVAMEKETQIKKWSRAKKLALINDEFEELPNLAKKDFG